MAYDRNPLLITFADKVQVRDLVTQKIGAKYLAESFGSFENLDGVQRDSFPLNFVMKANHGSGAVVICWEGAPRGSTIPKNAKHSGWEKYLIHPDDLIWEDLVSLSKVWMKLNYYWAIGRYPEWAYQNIPPQILVEEVLVQEESIPQDYKFFMINGICKFIQLDISRFGEHLRNLYSPDWQKIQAYCVLPNTSEVVSMPRNFDEMLHVASVLSKGIDFIRVDLYDTTKGVKFGELTNYPGGGMERFEPSQFSVDISREWKPLY